MFEIIELQHELTQNRLAAEGKDNDDDKYFIKARIASRNKDIDTLWKEKTSPDHISAILMIHPDIVKARIAALEKDEEERKEFLQFGIMSDSLQTGGYVGIFH